MHSEDRGACPDKTMMEYLTNVARQFGQNPDPPLQREQLEFIMRSYEQRCESAYTDLQPLKKRDWKGPHNMLSAADGNRRSLSKGRGGRCQRSASLRR